MSIDRAAEREARMAALREGLAVRRREIHEAWNEVRRELLDEALEQAQDEEERGHV